VQNDGVADLGEWYLWFAEHEAAGRSPLYEKIGRASAGDRELLASVCELPMAKRQPQLLLAAVRYVCGLAEDWAQFRDFHVQRREEIHAVISSRRTQTNEPARCAILLPLLAQLPQPLALLEVGAAAGLCLLIDRYAYDYDYDYDYDYGRTTIPPADGSADAPLFACRASDRTPIPTRPLEVVWRTGLDINPLDVTDPQDVAWLATLVWPGEGRRTQLLEAAVRVARRDPPRVVKGDLRYDLARLAERAPKAATLVVFHCSVLAYIDDPLEREQFGEQVLSLGARWVSSEGASVVPPAEGPQDQSQLAGQAVLALDGSPVARADMHGTWLHWL
jgi:hypothetical protein